MALTRAMFRPCIDLHGGRVKQIVGGTLSDSAAELQTNFVSSHAPSWYAAEYRRHNLTGGHIIMLGPGNEEAANDALQAWPGGMQLGGGINSVNAAAWLERGAAQLIVTSYIFADGELKEARLKELYGICTRERLVLDLSCRKRDGRYWIVTDRWQKFTRLELTRPTLEYLASYAAEFLIHAVDVEGKQSGIDAELLELLAANSPIRCVYAGGIASFADVDFIMRRGGGKIDYTIGSALDIFGGRLSYAELLNTYCRQ